ncbi:hypothetical protein THAOC_23419, partial [Thalassiosira oceanica]
MLLLFNADSHLNLTFDFTPKFLQVSRLLVFVPCDSNLSLLQRLRDELQCDSPICPSPRNLRRVLLLCQIRVLDNRRQWPAAAAVVGAATSTEEKCA